MASSATPLLTDNYKRQRQHYSTTSNSSAGEEEEEEEEPTTTILYGLFTTSPTRPLATIFHPTLLTRAFSILLLLPAFIILLVVKHHTPLPSYIAAIVFLSFALARQLYILGSFFGSRLVVIRVEVVHVGLKDVLLTAMGAKEEEAWVRRRILALVVDGVVLLGLLVSLALVARDVDVCRRGPACGMPAAVTAAVVLGFLGFGLLLLSIPDFGTLDLVTLSIAVEKPAGGLYKLATHVLFGEVGTKKVESTDV